MHISLTRTTNKQTGERRYFLDGRRVSRERFEFAEFSAARLECIHFTSSRKVERSHKLASGDKYAYLPF